MAKFLKGNELNSELEKLFEKAEEQLILISPYIKLHDRYASTLRTKINNPKLKITIVFGKNEYDISKSMKQEDFIFFKEFPNIEIRYEKRLHAKYYASENYAIMTSMNLHSYSQNNNIESGILTNASILENFADKLITNVTGENSFDNQAWDYFTGEVVDNSVLLFRKLPQFDKGTLGIGINKKYLSSEIEVDKLSDFFADKPKVDTFYRKDKPNESKNIEQFVQPTNSIDSCIPTGFCIRTGIPIPFNVENPMCYDAFRTWNEFGNRDYPERFCHFSGEPSNGETSVNRPILKKNWKKAKEIFDF